MVREGGEEWYEKERGSYEKGEEEKDGMRRKREVMRKV